MSPNTPAPAPARHPSTKHGFRKTPEYAAWTQMKFRCYGKTHDRYANYGGRGISVCTRWRDSFENFLSDMGMRPSKGHSLDRIDNDGNYEPGNCRWATRTEQARNQSKTVFSVDKAVAAVTMRLQGETVPRISREIGISQSAIYNVLRGKHWKESHSIASQIASLNEILPT